MDENTTNALPRRPGVFRDLTGMVFGRLTVIGPAENIMSGERSVVAWKCVCGCGEGRTIRTDHLTTGACKTCGCSRKIIGPENRGWKGIGDLPGHYFCHLKNRAKAKRWDFNVTPEYLWNMFLTQERKCALSGLEIEFPKEYRKRGGTASLDRMFSSSGYVVGNVQWVHRDINIMKNIFRPEVFHMYCWMVANRKNPTS